MEDLHAIASPPEEEEREETGEGQQPSGEEQLAINDYLKTEPLWDKVHYSGKDDSGNYIYTNRFTEEQMPQFTSVDQAKETVEKFKQFNITYKDVDFVEISTPDIQNQDAEKLFEDRTNSLNEMATMLGHPLLRNRVGKNAAQLAEGDISNPELRAERGIKYLDDERLADHTRKYGDSFEGVNTEDPDALLEAILGCSDCKGFNLQLDSDENPIRYQYIKEDNNNLCEGSVTLDRINNLYIKREYLTQNGIQIR